MMKMTRRAALTAVSCMLLALPVMAQEAAPRPVPMTIVVYEAGIAWNDPGTKGGLLRPVLAGWYVINMQTASEDAT